MNVAPDEKHPILAREGWVHVVLAVAIAAIVHYRFGAVAALPLWLLVAFIVQFFRDPRRTIPATRFAVVAPADGKVVAVGEVHDPYLERPARRISIFMNVFNVHTNRSPSTGKVMKAWYHRGKFLNAALEKSSEANERNALWIRTEEGQDVVVVQVAGLIARRILCYVRPGDQVRRGQRYGFIRFGSRVDLYLPAASRLEVALGDKVKGGSDIVAELAQ